MFKQKVELQIEVKIAPVSKDLTTTRTQSKLRNSHGRREQVQTVEENMHWVADLLAAANERKGRRNSEQVGTRAFPAQHFAREIPES